MARHLLRWTLLTGVSLLLWAGLGYGLLVLLGPGCSSKSDQAVRQHGLHGNARVDRRAKQASAYPLVGVDP